MPNCRSNCKPIRKPNAPHCHIHQRRGTAPSHPDWPRPERPRMQRRQPVAGKRGSRTGAGGQRGKRA
eukprot:7860190-Alexandrium_andersonii.AAC.1